jgi:hypothetical protein
MIAGINGSVSPDGIQNAKPPQAATPIGFEIDLLPAIYVLSEDEAGITLAPA